MNLKCIVALLVLSPVPGFCNTDAYQRIFPHSVKQQSDYTVESRYSNEQNVQTVLQKANRSIDVPTHIIRTQGAITQPVRCEEVTGFINEKVLNPIIYNNFTYNMYVTCTYDRETEYATYFSINSYFDPLSDSAVTYLNQYLQDVNGLNVFDTSIHIETAKGVVISTNLIAGSMKKPNTPPFILHRQDRGNVAFKSNYEMVKVMLTDVYENFYSDDPDKILPFLNRWIFPTAGFTYYYVLLKSNYAELQPERIFLMEKEGDLFVSNLRYHYGHLCHKHAHKHCIKTGYHAK